MFRRDDAKILTATINWREVACRDEALYVRRFGIGRCQERGKCYATLRQTIESRQDKNAPIQNVPMRPKQPSSIRVDTGFMLRLTLNAELNKRV
jgi:hypothetical protein